MTHGGSTDANAAEVILANYKFPNGNIELGSLGAKPAAKLTLYALRPGHTFDMRTFIGGNMPPQTEVALK